MADMDGGRRISNRSILAVIAVIAFAGLFYWFTWDDAPVMTRDSNDYMEVAVDLRDGGLDDIHFRAPGYPLLLLLTDSVGETSRLLFFIQLSLHLVSVMLIAFFLIRFGLHGVLILLFLVLALLPPNVVLSVYVLTEALSEFLIVAGTIFLFLSFEKDRIAFKTTPLILSGLVFGLAAVVKPTHQLLFIPLSGIMLLFMRFGWADKKKRLSVIIGLIVIPVMIIGGLYVYNYVKLNYIGLTPSFGYHFSSKTARVVERLPDEYADVREVLVSSRDTILVERHGRHSGENYIWLARPELERITGLDKPGLSRYLLRMNLVLIRKAPLQYIKEVNAALTQYWFPLTTPISNFDSRLMQLLWSFIHFIVISVFLLVLFLLASLVSMRWFLPREARMDFYPKRESIVASTLFFIIPLSIIIYTMLISTMFEAGHQRYRTPTELLIFFVALLGVHFLFGIRSKASNKKRTS